MNGGWYCVGWTTSTPRKVADLARPKCRTPHSPSIDRFGDVGGNAQQTVPMQTTRPQHDAMRMSSATAPSWGPPSYVVNSAAGFTRGVWVPMGWHGGIGGGAPAEWGDQHQQHGFGTTPMMGAPPPMGLSGALSPVPGHLPSSDKWNRGILGEGGDEEKEHGVPGDVRAL